MRPKASRPASTAESHPGPQETTKPLSPRLKRWRRRLRWPLRLLAVLALLGSATSYLLACTTTIRPPANPANPVTVYLLDEGRTSALVMPLPDGRLVRYVYGDWNFYALMNNGVLDALGALFWPSQGALGRNFWPPPPTAEHVRQLTTDYVIDDVLPVNVSREQVDRLEAELDRLYQANKDSEIYNKPYDLYFVHHPQKYWAIQNSNRMIARYLEDLGCDVRGPALYSKWRVKPPAGAAEAQAN